MSEQAARPDCERCPVHADTHDAAHCLAVLGALLLDAGESVTSVRAHLVSVRDTLALPPMEFSVLPSLVLVTPYATGSPVAAGSLSGLPFRQAARANQLPSRLRSGVVALADVPEVAREIRASSRPRSLPRTIIGNAIIAAGFAALFNGPWWAVLTALVVGVPVAVAMWLFERSQPGTALEPFVISFLSTALVGAAAHAFAFPSISLFAVLAPVVILVPGSVIAMALFEATSSDIVAGTSRLVGGLVVMGFMAAGTAAGSSVTGIRIDPTTAALIGDIVGAVPYGGWEANSSGWVSWASVLALAIGTSIMFQSGVRLTAVTAVIMCTAYGATLALSPALGAVVAVGTGSGIVFLAAKVIERVVPALPSAVTFLPAFLLFVPGTLGLVSLATQNTASISTALFSFTSLLVGIHVGGLVDLWFDRSARRGR